MQEVGDPKLRPEAYRRFVTISLSVHVTVCVSMSITCLYLTVCVSIIDTQTVTYIYMSTTCLFVTDCVSMCTTCLYITDCMSMSTTCLCVTNCVYVYNSHCICMLQTVCLCLQYVYMLACMSTSPMCLECLSLQYVCMLQTVYVCNMSVCYRLHKLLEQEPSNEKIYFNLGMLSMDDHNFRAALEWFDKATKVHKNVLFNISPSTTYIDP